MIYTLFWSIVALQTVIICYFLWRFIYNWLRYRTWSWASLVCAYGPLGWVVAVARELQLLRRWTTTPLLALSLVSAVLGVLVLANAERQLYRRWRESRYFQRRRG